MLYALRGAEFPPGLLEERKKDLTRRRDRKVLKDFGWTQDGQVWILYELSASTVQSGVVSVPAAIRQFVPDTMQLVTTDDAPVGTLAVRDGAAWGLGPFFRRRGGEAGDGLRITINRPERRALVEILNEEERAQDRPVAQVSPGEDNGRPPAAGVD
jgi:hypothetical protein